MLSSIRHWWNREAGIREVLVIALPLVVSTSSWTLMQFIDRSFLLYYSEAAMAAALPSGMLNFWMLCVFMGIAMYVNTFVAQYYGAGRYERIGAAVWQGVFLGLAVIPFALLTIPMAPRWFAWAGHEMEVQRLEVIYYQVLCYGAGAMVMGSALSSFFSGRGHVRTVMAVDSVSALVNVVLDYAWIFGRWGFPEWGMAGAAWATVVALWFKVFLYLALMVRPSEAARYGVWSGLRYDGELMRRLLRYGAPSGAQIVLDVTGFTGFLLILGRLGPEVLTASNLAFNINNLAFMPVFGLGIATTTLVGQRLGENRADLAERSTWSVLVVAIGYSLAMGVLYLATPAIFLHPFRGQMSAEDFARLHDVTTVLLRYVATYCLLDSTYVVFVSALKGAGDTRFIMRACCAVACSLLLLTWVGQEVFRWGMHWSWMALTLCIFGLGLTFLLRFLAGHWREMRVIEVAELPGLDANDAVLLREPAESCG